MHRLHKQVRLLAALLVLALLLGGCAELARRYDRSIYDSAVFRAADQSNHLVAIEELPVTVVTWTSWDGYEVGPTTLGRDVWVTVVPQVRNECRSFKPKKLGLRLEQLLGLPPGDGKTFFVELRVGESGDIFRPCTDPAIDTTGPCIESFPDDVPGEHVEWMARQAFSSWQVGDGYPWTRLGYTYDWNPRTDQFGPSEYVVRSGAEVEVLSVATTAEYCQASARN